MNWPRPATIIQGSASAASIASVGPDPVSTSAIGRAATTPTTSSGTPTSPTVAA